MSLELEQNNPERKEKSYMAKLTPPKIDNILPAFVNNSSDNTLYFTIPYQLNLSVKDADFRKIKYIIRSATTNSEIEADTVTKGSFNAKKN
jgi:hypothetical protein